MMVSKITFQILIATMNRENLDFLYKMFPNSNIEGLNIIIVNQTTPQKILKSNLLSVKVINSFDKGLSKSRNLALENATSNWCLIADDDLVYVIGFENIISSGIEEYNSSGVVVFKSMVDAETPRRDFPETSKKHITTLKQFNVASFEMVLNRSIPNPLFFNENFGLGSNVFLFGEEVVLMRDYIEEGFSVSYCDKAIVFHPKDNTGTIYEHSLRYFTKGGVLKYTYPKKYVLWIFIQLFFDVKQHKISLWAIFKNYREAIKGAKKLNNINNAAY